MLPVTHLSIYDSITLSIQSKHKCQGFWTQIQPYSLDICVCSVIYREMCQKQHWLSSSKSRSICNTVYSTDVMKPYYQIRLLVSASLLGAMYCQNGQYRISPLKNGKNIQVNLQIMLWCRFFFLPNAKQIPVRIQMQMQIQLQMQIQMQIQMRISFWC